MSPQPEKKHLTEPPECVQRVGEPKPYPVEVWTDDADEPEGEETHEEPGSGSSSGSTS